MSISFSPQQQIGSTNSSYYSNVNLPKNTPVNDRKSERRDVENKSSMSINSMGTSLGGKPKRNSMLKSLMEQKINLIDSKNKFMEKAVKNGDDPLSIKEKIKGMDKQIKEINKQISKIQLEEQRKAIGNEDKIKKSKSSKQTSNDVSPNEAQTDCSMESILSLSCDLRKTKELSHQRNKMAGDARVLAAEIKVDEGRGIDPVAKRKQLDKMKDNVENITEKLGEYSKDVNTKVNNNTQSNVSNNVVDKNEQKKDVGSRGNVENLVELLINQQQASQSIKHYKDNINYEAKYKGEKINIIA